MMICYYQAISAVLQKNTENVGSIIIQVMSLELLYYLCIVIVMQKWR